MNLHQTGTSSIELKSKQPRLSVRIAARILSEPFAVNAIALVIIFAIFGG